MCRSCSWISRSLGTRAGVVIGLRSDAVGVVSCATGSGSASHHGPVRVLIRLAVSASAQGAGCAVFEAASFPAVDVCSTLDA